MSIVNLVGDQEVTSVQCFKVANFQFDAQFSGGHESVKTVTENPLESGAKVNDHSFLEQKTITVTGAMTTFEPYNLVGFLAGNEINFVKSIPIVGGIFSKTDSALHRINMFSASISQAYNTATSTARKFSKYLPDSVNQWVGDETAPTDRIQEAYQTLLSIQASDELLTVYTKTRMYNNMTLIGVQLQENAGDRGDFTLTCREMLVVETKTVQGLVVPKPQAKKIDGKSKSGRSEKQGEATKNKGKTSPQKVETTSKKSALKSIGDLLK